MNVLVLIAVTIMIVMLYVGLHFVTEPNRESRVIGICTLLWVGIACYLLIGQYMLAKQQASYGIVTIAMLSTVGYIVGRAVVAIFRPEPVAIEERAQWR